MANVKAYDAARNAQNAQQDAVVGRAYAKVEKAYAILQGHKMSAFLPDCRGTKPS